MKRFTILTYGVACYAIFLFTFLYAIGFLANAVVPKSIDSPVTSAPALAIVINLILLSVFAIQHSVMARPAFKKWWTRFVPEAAERSTYVLFSSIALLLLFWLWQPIAGVVWNVESPAWQTAIWILYGIGWLTILISTCLINHFDLFGLRQVWLAFRGQPYTPLRFTTPGPYKWVRHPLYVGWLIAFWATPTMTIARLVFAIVTTAYILVAIKLEEKDLTAFHGAKYERYRQNVGMLIPRWRKTRSTQSHAY